MARPGCAFLLYYTYPLNNWLRQTIGEPSIIPQWNLGGVWGNPTALIVLGFAAVALHNAGDIKGRSARLGVIGYFAGPALGLLTMVINPAHIVTWLLDWAIRAVF